MYRRDEEEAYLHCNPIPTRATTCRIAAHPGRRLSLFIALVIASALIGSRNLDSQEATPTEDEVKAAYLYNLGKFVEWPAKTTTAPHSFPLSLRVRYPFVATPNTL